jgi:hypothetical protein
MTEIGFQGLTILLLLLPGFLCARIVQALFVRPQQTETDKVIEALIYTLIIYWIYTRFIGELPLQLIEKTWGDSHYYSFVSDPRKLGYLLLISALAGLFSAFLLTSDLLGRLLRALRITQRTSYTTVWSDVFHHIGGYVMVRLNTGETVVGWVKFYSDSDEKHSLFLEDAAWVSDDNKQTPIPGPGILLTRESKIRSIAFLDSVVAESTGSPTITQAMSTFVEELSAAVGKCLKSVHRASWKQRQ